MQFIVSRRLVRLGGVDPPYRQKKKKNKKKKKKKTCGYCSCIYTFSSSLSCPSFIERLLELAELSFFSGEQISRYIDAKEPIREKLLFLSPIRSRK